MAVAALFSIALTASAASGSSVQQRTKVHGVARDAVAGSPVLLETMTGELQRAFTSLGKPGINQKDGEKVLPPYFISYSISDANAFRFVRSMARWPIATPAMCGWQTCRFALAIPSSTILMAIIALRR